MEAEKLGKMTFDEMVESIKTSNDLTMAVDDVLKLTKAIGKRASGLESPETLDEVVKSLMTVYSSLDDISSSYLVTIMEAYTTKKNEPKDDEVVAEINIGKVENANDVLSEMSLIMNIISGIHAVATEIVVLDDRTEVAEGVKDIFDSIEGVVLMADNLVAKSRDIGIKVKGLSDLEQLIHHVFVLGRVVESLNARDAANR